MISEQTSPEAVSTLRVVMTDLLRRNNYVLEKNCEGISHDKSLIRLGDDGSNFNWLLGHITASRDVCTRLLGAETQWPKDQGRRYGRGSGVVPPEEAEEFNGLLAHAIRSGERLQAALEAASNEELSLPNPRNADERVVDAIFFLIWHDTYHAGQTALYRRLAGLSGVFG